MATKTVTLELRADDAEPILRDAAFDAAKFSALLDYMTQRTHDCPGRGQHLTGWYQEARKEWQAHFLRGKRIVEAFGVEYEQTSEAETLTVCHDYVGGTRRKTEGGFVVVEGSRPDYDNPIPAYRREVHTHACHAAAERVVRRWRAL